MYLKRKIYSWNCWIPTNKDFVERDVCIIRGKNVLSCPFGLQDASWSARLPLTLKNTALRPALSKSLLFRSRTKRFNLYTVREIISPYSPLARDYIGACKVLHSPRNKRIFSKVSRAKYLSRVTYKRS